MGGGGGSYFGIFLWCWLIFVYFVLGEGHLWPEWKKPDDPRKVCCQICGKVMWKRNLAEHMRFHTGEKPYWCSSCDRGFSKKYNLRVHKCSSAHK